MDQDLLDLANNGLEKRIQAQQISEQKLSQYYEQLQHEAELINSKEMGFRFLAAKDIVQHLKNKGFIVGPGGGHANASLLAYALGIHDVDPIRHGLIFETYLYRFSSPGFQFFLCRDGYVEAHNYLCKRYGENHIAWDGYHEFSALVITHDPVKDALKVTGARPDFPVVNMSNDTGEFHGISLTLIPIPLLGRMLRTSRFIVDEWKEPYHLNFEEFHAPCLENHTIKGTLPEWLPDTHTRVPLLDCLKKLGSPKSFDDFIFAYYLATTFTDDVERENLIREWVSASRTPPWDRSTICEDEKVQEILACSKGIVIYAEQIIQLSAYYQGISISESYQWFWPIRQGRCDQREHKRADFISRAYSHGHDKIHAAKIFDFLLDRADKNNFRFKSHVVGQTLLANGAAQLSQCFDLAGA